VLTHNTYFDGQVQSIGFTRNGLRASVGVIAPGEFRFGTDHPVYLRHALMVMQRHRDQFDWLCEKPGDFQKRPGGWPETRYEAKARRIGHEVWYFRYRKRDA
jgi:uncharacterized protein YaiE (UPF0345 family)